MNKNSVFGDNHYLNKLKKLMINKKLANKNSSYEEITKKFNSLKSKDDILKNIHVPIMKI